MRKHGEPRKSGRAIRTCAEVLIEMLPETFWAMLVLIGVVSITVMGAIGLWGSTSSEGDSPASQEHK